MVRNEINVSSIWLLGVTVAEICSSGPWKVPTEYHHFNFVSIDYLVDALDSVDGGDLCDSVPTLFLLSNFICKDVFPYG